MFVVAANGFVGHSSQPGDVAAFAAVALGDFGFDGHSL